MGCMLTSNTTRKTECNITFHLQSNNHDTGCYLVCFSFTSHPTSFYWLMKERTSVVRFSSSISQVFVFDPLVSRSFWQINYFLPNIFHTIFYAKSIIYFHICMQIRFFPKFQNKFQRKLPIRNLRLGKLFSKISIA